MNLRVSKKIMNKFVVYIGLTLCFLQGYANSPESKTETEDNRNGATYEEKPETIKKETNRFDLVAKKIAGKYTENNEHNEDHVLYSRSIEQSWNKLYNESLSKIPEWTDRYITPFVSCFDTVFYPFGGPDIAYAFSFFPKATRFILVGLEPLGNFDKMEKSLSNLKTYDSIKTAFRTYLKKGYFITSEMISHLSNTNIRGGLNLVLLGISRMGYSVIRVRSCGIDADGKIVDSGVGNTDCLEIVCEKDNKKKYVYYIRTDLSNSNPRLYNLMQFVYQFEFVTFIKSASYALHDRTLSRIRSFILRETNCILQDDTGIPFNFFRQNWDIRIFGKYSKPTLPVFRTYKQNSLEDYYNKHSAKAITFPIGYGYIQRNPNLIFAISKTKIAINQMKELRRELQEKKCDCIFK